MVDGAPWGAAVVEAAVVEGAALGVALEGVGLPPNQR